MLAFYAFLEPNFGFSVPLRARCWASSVFCNQVVALDQIWAWDGGDTLGQSSV